MVSDGREVPKHPRRCVSSGGNRSTTRGRRGLMRGLVVVSVIAALSCAVNVQVASAGEKICTQLHLQKKHRNADHVVTREISATVSWCATDARVGQITGHTFCEGFGHWSCGNHLFKVISVSGKPNVREVVATAHYKRRLHKVVVNRAIMQFCLVV